MTATGQDLLAVRLVGLPLQLLSASQERADDLSREFSHIADSDSDAPPARLLALSQQLNGQYGGHVRPAQEQIDAATARGDDSIDVTFEVPRAAAGAARQLWALLDEADEFCRSGQLLTLATPPELVKLRQWYLSQFIDQAAGAEPVPWDEFSEAPSR